MFSEIVEPNLPLKVTHFQQNGNIKNITHIDSSLNELSVANLEVQKSASDIQIEDNDVGVPVNTPNTYEEIVISNKDVKEINKEPEEIDERYSLLKYPRGTSIFNQFIWIITWPIHLLFTFTIPNCETPRFKNWFPLTFIMCIVWIGSLSYVVAWMITIIGKYST